MSQYSDKKRGQTTAVSIPSEKRVRMQPPPSGPPIMSQTTYPYQTYSSSPPSPPRSPYYAAPSSPTNSNQYATIPTDNIRASAQTQSQIPIAVAPVLSPCNLFVGIH